MFKLLNLNTKMSKHHISPKLLSKKVLDCALENAQFWTGNSQYYSGSDILRILLVSALENTSVEDTSTNLRKNLNSNIPSQDTVLRVLHSNYKDLSVIDIQNQIAHNLQILVKSLPQYKHKRSKVVLAIDLHDEEYYGNDIFDAEGRQITMIGQKRDKSGKARKVFRTGSICIVKWGKKLANPLTIGFAVNYKGQAREELVQQLIEQIAPLKLRVDYLTIDGGFAGQKIFKYLSLESINFITRGRISKKKKYAGVVEGNGFEYPLITPGKEDYRVFAYLTKVKYPNDTKKKVLLLSSKFINLKEIKRIYKTRFRIENTYRHARNAKIRTSTRKPHLRWLFWGISLFIELIWEIIRSIHETSGINKYESRQKMVNRVLHDFIMENLANAKLLFE